MTVEEKTHPAPYERGELTTKYHYYLYTNDFLIIFKASEEGS